MLKSKKLYIFLKLKELIYRQIHSSPESLTCHSYAEP